MGVLRFMRRLIGAVGLCAVTILGTIVLVVIGSVAFVLIGVALAFIFLALPFVGLSLGDAIKVAKKKVDKARTTPAGNPISD